MDTRLLYNRIVENYHTAERLVTTFLQEWFEGLDYKTGTVFERRRKKSPLPTLSWAGDRFVIEKMTVRTGVINPSCKIHVTPITKKWMRDRRSSMRTNYILLRPEEYNPIESAFVKVEGKWHDKEKRFIRKKV